MTKSGVFEFDPEDKIYRQHFPGRPVVPGVLIIRSFIDRLGACPGPGGFSIDHFNFNHFAGPGKYQFRITEKDGGYLCRMEKDGRLYAEGKVSPCA